MEDYLTLFEEACKDGKPAKIDAVLLDWVQFLNGCEGGYISWEGDLPTHNNLKLSDLIYLTENLDEWTNEDFLLNLNQVVSAYAGFWRYGGLPDA